PEFGTSIAQNGFLFGPKAGAGQEKRTKSTRPGSSFGLFPVAPDRVEPWQRRGVPVILDQFGHDIGEIALDADILIEQAVDQALTAVHIARRDHQEIIDTPADRPARYDFRDGGNRPLKTIEIVLAMITQR